MSEFKMIINVLKNPLAVWYKTSSTQGGVIAGLPDITYGWNELNQKLSSENLNLDISKNPTWRNDFNNSKYYRNDIIFEKFRLLDGLASLHRALKFENLNMREFDLHSFDNKLLVVTERDYDLLNAKLRFTAPKKFRNDILNGRQPLRSTAYYRRVFNRELPSADLTEGAILASLSSKINRDIKGYIHDVTIADLPFESHIFSLHDSNVGLSEIKKFGDDTYEILDLPKWIQSIVEEVNKHWLSKNVGFVGSFVFFGMMKYEKQKSLKNLDTMDNLSRSVSDIDEFNRFNPFKHLDVNYQVDGMDIRRYGIRENIVDDCCRYHFVKPARYDLESEHRLCIVPLCSDPHRDGPSYFQHDDDQFFMNIDGYREFLRLL